MTGSPVLPAHLTDDEEATIRTAEALGQAGDVGEATRLLEAAIAAAAVRSVELPGRLTGQLASYYRMQGRGADEVRLLEYFHAPRKSERMRNRFLARLAAKTDCVEPEGMDRRDGTG